MMDNNENYEKFREGALKAWQEKETERGHLVGVRRHIANDTWELKAETMDGKLIHSVIDEGLDSAIIRLLTGVNYLGYRIVNESELRRITGVTIWYSVKNMGDGSAYPIFFLSNEHARLHQESLSEGWGEYCTGSVETFIGSATYRGAKYNSDEKVYEGDN